MQSRALRQCAWAELLLRPLQPQARLTWQSKESDGDQTHGAWQDLELQRKPVPIKHPNLSMETSTGPVDGFGEEQVWYLFMNSQTHVKCEYQDLPIVIHDISWIYSFILSSRVITEVNGKSFVPNDEINFFNIKLHLSNITMNNWSFMSIWVAYKIYLSNVI